MDAVSSPAVKSYVAGKVRDGALSARSINSTLRILHVICESAVEDGYLSANPVTRSRYLRAGKPERTWLEPDEVASLLDVAGNHRALLGVMVYAGLRVSEAASLRWRAVDLNAGRIRVESSKTDAGRRTVADLPPELIADLKRHRERALSIDPNALVFPTSTGRERTRSAVSRQI